MIRKLHFHYGLVAKQHELIIVVVTWILDIIGRPYGVVVFDNEPPLEARVAQLHERHSLERNWETPAESGSLSNTTTPHMFSILSCMLNLTVSHMCCYWWVSVLLLPTISSNFIQFVSCGLLELGVTDGIVAALWCHAQKTRQPCYGLRHSNYSWISMSESHMFSVNILPQPHHTPTPICACTINPLKW